MDVEEVANVENANSNAYVENCFRRFVFYRDGSGVTWPLDKTAERSAWRHEVRISRVWFSNRNCRSKLVVSLRFILIAQSCLAIVYIFLLFYRSLLFSLFILFFLIHSYLVCPARLTAPKKRVCLIYNTRIWDIESRRLIFVIVCFAAGEDPATQMHEYNALLRNPRVPSVIDNSSSKTRGPLSSQNKISRQVGVATFTIMSPRNPRTPHVTLWDVLFA